MLVRLLLLLGISLATVGWLSAQNCGSRDTVLLQAQGATDYVLTIDDLVNNDLSDTNQGICGVEIGFAHQYIYDVVITLVSPSGQEVVLVGPDNSQVRPPTIFARWFIDFTQCGQTADPDPGAPAVWNNNHPFNWSVGAVYTGTYHPNGGCLEDFNTGPANGSWTLRVESSRPGADGAVIDFRLVFCDETGFDCCFADAGVITADELIRCENHPDLQLDLPPSYSQPRPDTNEYDYAYLIGLDDNFFGIDSTLDFTAYAPGNYQVCGFSYRQGELPNLPPTDGSISLQDFRDDLASLTPTLCGDISDDCFTLTILPLVDTTFLVETICTGDSYTVGNNTYTLSGNYTNDLVALGLCDSVVVLDLEVVDRLQTNLDTTICFGNSINVGPSTYDQSGVYEDTLQSSFGCDSIVSTQLTVRAENTATLLTTLCNGDTLFVGGEAFTSSIVTTRILTDMNGCDSTVSIDLVILDPQINLGVIPVLNCFTDDVIIDASASVTQFPPTFRWLDSNNDQVGIGAQLTLDTAGVYVLELTEARFGVVCSVRDTFEIEDQTTLPALDGTTPDTLTCGNTFVEIGGPATSSGVEFNYQWTGPAGAVFLDPTNQPITRVTTPGSFELLVINTATGCRDSLMLEVEQDTISPSANINGGGVLNCAIDEILLWGDSLQVGSAELEFSWTSPACLAQPVVSNRLTINCAGAYTLEVRNTRTGCTSTQTVIITEDRVLPTASIDNPNVLTCYEPTISLNGRNSSPAPNLIYDWHLPGGPNLSIADTLDVTTANTYELLVINNQNFCRDSTTVTVLANQVFPVADAGLDTTALTCYQPTQVIGGNGTSQGSEFVYTWTVVGLPSDTLGTDELLTVNDPGGYFELAVLDVDNGCISYDSSRVLLQLDTPFVRLQEPVAFGCFAETVELNASQTFLDYDFMLEWAGGPCLPDDPDSTVITVECPGTYSLTITNLDNGCVGDSTVTVVLEPNAVVAVLPDSAFIDCVTGLTIIDHSNSTMTVNRDWLLNGDPVNLIGANPTVNVPGTYSMILSNFDGSCSDTATIEVVADCPLLSIIAPPDSLTCNNTEIVLDATTSIPQDPVGTTIEWLIPNPACAQPGMTDREIVVACSGTYGFVITDNLNGESDTSFVTVVQDLIEPVADAGPNDTLTCSQPVVVLDAINSEQDPRFQYIWTNFGTDTLGIGQTVNVNASGVYLLQVLNTETGCLATDAITVFQDFTTPDLDFSNTFIPCREDSFALTVIPDPLLGNYSFGWSGPLIQDQQDSSTVIIGQEGVYTATVTNLDNGCPTAEDITLEQLPCPPCISLNDTAFTCVSPVIFLQPDYCEPCVGCTFQWFLNGTPIMGATSDLLGVSEVGEYRLRAVNTFGLSTILTVTVGDLRILPDLAAGPDRFLTCDSNSVTLGRTIIDTVFGFTYQWLDETGSPIPGATDNFLSVTQPGLYGLQSSNAISSCSQIDTVMVTYDTIPPTVDAGPPVELTCDDPLGVLDAQGTTTGSAIDYVWSGGITNACLEGANTLSPIVACGGTYELWVRDNRNGCINQDTVVVTASDEIPQIIPMEDTVFNCVSGSITLEPFLEDPAYTSRWCQLDQFNDTIPGSCVDGLQFTATAIGTYAYTVTNGITGCSTGFRVEIAEDFRTPQVMVGPSDTFYCTLDSLALTGSGITESGQEALYSWVSQTGFVINSSDQDTAFAFQPDRYYLTVTDPQNGCTATDSIEFFQDITAPIAFAGLDTSLNCQIRQLRLQGNGQTFSGQIQYNWSTIDGNILADANTAAPLVNGIGNYLFSVTDPVNSCTTQDIVAVLEDTIRPQAIFTDETYFSINCYLPTTTLDASLSTSNAGHPLTYSWRTQGVGTDLTGQTMETVVVDATGSYQLVVTDEVNRCRDTLSVSVASDFVQPVVTVPEPGLLTCDTQSVNLIALAPNDLGNYTYSWTQEPQGLQLGMASVQSVSQTGDYALVVQDTLNGCIRERSVSVLADVDLPVIQLATPEVLNCDRASVLLDAEGSSVGNNFALSWTTVSGAFNALPSPYRIRAEEAGVYTFTIENTINGCVNAQDVIVERDARSIDALDFEVIDPACENDVSGSVLILGVDGGTGPYRFRLDGGLLTSRMAYDDLPVGTYDLEVIDSSGCNRVESVTIRPANPIFLSLGPDVTIALGDSVALNFTTNATIWDTLIWTSEGPLPSPGVLPAYVSPSTAATYRLMLLDSSGCTATDDILISVDNALSVYVPNAFSPNGDNNNDLFFPYAGPQVTEIKRFQVFDRWGNMVHDAANFPAGNPAFGWDGTLDGKPLNMAVFVWVLEVELVTGEVIFLRGDVLLGG